MSQGSQGSRFGVQTQLALAVIATIVVASLAISATLYYFSREHSYANNLKRSEDMVQAASLAFAQALASGDEVLLDALLHELRSREELHIRRAYVMDASGRVVAHTNIDEYGKQYPLPDLLAGGGDETLYQTLPVADGSDYQVQTLLQELGENIGVLVVQFTTDHLEAEVRSELFSIIGVTLPVLILSSLLVMVFGRGIVTRLRQLQAHTVHIGRGTWNAPLPEEGRDEIADLNRAFNQMQRDLAALREKDWVSSQTIDELHQELRQRLQQVEQLKEQLVEENAVLRERLVAETAGQDIIGAEGGMREVIHQAAKLAPVPVTVLISGESGTGKELLANYLHRHSDREGPLVTVNCAALPAALIESELFGHEKGAFTDAHAQKKGKFELAAGGTLFLDEIGEMSLEAQAKLLRALQENEIYRVGGTHAIKVDVRVVAATNRDLQAEVAAGRFREDLYYRLKVAELHCPLLRERLDDLPALAQFFIERYAEKLGKPVVGIAPAALALLAEHNWPGNVRELENTIARAVALAETRVLGPADFSLGSTPARGGGSTSTEAVHPDVGTGESAYAQLLRACGVETASAGSPASWETVTAACERLQLETALLRYKNQKEAAAALGLHPTKLHRLVKKYGLKGGK